jgi:Tc toxin complex TcA C-terminal TcB-binding domain
MATGGGPGGVSSEEKLRFYTFQHPYVCEFIEALTQSSSADHLFDLAIQSRSMDTIGIIPPNLFRVEYQPSSLIDDAYPAYNVDFDNHGAYAQYNWELFFHIPLFIATRLMQDQRHEEAMQWFHYIFNPMTDDNTAVPQRYWNFKPFRDQGVPERIQDLLWTLQDPNPDKKKIEELKAAIDDWRAHPFQPHRIARGRPGAYMKTVVMKYLDNLIEWGDKLFRRDTIESINEATQLYILAANLLWLRPHRVPPVVKETGGPPTYAMLRKTLDDFSNGIVQVETLIPFSFGAGGNGTSNGAEGILGLANLAFCIPSNDKLLGYWDTVEDRLFKIRQCMNIEGVVRELPLFEPPIDPALLVRATAMGLDLSQVLDDLAAPLPHYRFTFMLQKAREFCEELKQLGNLLLSALEKKDAEKLAQIRAGHEKALLEAVREVKRQQINEAENTLASLEKAKELVDARKTHYVAVSARLAEETQFMTKQTEAVVFQMASQMAALEGSMAATVPEINVIAAGMNSGTSTQVASGKKIALVANLISTYLGWLGQIASLEGTTASYKGGLIRTQQDRDLQIKLATIESQQLDKQIAAADFRRQIAEKDLANHEKQIEQASEIDDFLREKFTNQDLYNWMVSQVAAVYFQAYKLAYDIAKRTERTYRHELGIADSRLVQFGAWDNLRNGLLAGERLSLDLRRLEHAYLENNKRELELTKHVSLRQLNPLALLTLKATGTCQVTIPEWLYDLDCPGHYMRRIKSVALSIPSVAGPYTSVNCTLSLIKSTVRRSPSLANGKYERDVGKEDTRFMDYYGTVQSIVTSSGQSDSGMFETSLRDERFLPFEGSGAESTWKLELPDPEEYPAFDYTTISDVILHLRYTARQGVELTAVKKVLHELFKNPSNLALVFSLRHDFPTEWSAFVNAKDNSPFTAMIRKDYFPYFTQGKKITIVGLELYDGTDVSKHHAIEEAKWDDAKQGWVASAGEDTAEDSTKPKVLTRAASTEVFLVIRYSLSA